MPTKHPGRVTTKFRYASDVFKRLYATDAGTIQAAIADTPTDTLMWLEIANTPALSGWIVRGVRLKDATTEFSLIDSLDGWEQLTGMWGEKLWYRPVYSKLLRLTDGYPSYWSMYDCSEAWVQQEWSVWVGDKQAPPQSVRWHPTHPVDVATGHCFHPRVGVGADGLLISAQSQYMVALGQSTPAQASFPNEATIVEWHGGNRYYYPGVVGISYVYYTHAPAGPANVDFIVLHPAVVRRTPSIAGFDRIDRTAESAGQSNIYCRTANIQGPRSRDWPDGYVRDFLADGKLPDGVDATKKREGVVFWYYDPITVSAGPPTTPTPPAAPAGTFQIRKYDKDDERNWLSLNTRGQPNYDPAANTPYNAFIRDPTKVGVVLASNIGRPFGATNLAGGIYDPLPHARTQEEACVTFVVEHLNARQNFSDQLRALVPNMSWQTRKLPVQTFTVTVHDALTGTDKLIKDMHRATIEDYKVTTTLSLGSTHFILAFGPQGSGGTKCGGGPLESCQHIPRECAYATKKPGYWRHDSMYRTTDHAAVAGWIAFRDRLIAAVSAALVAADKLGCREVILPAVGAGLYVGNHKDTLNATYYAHIVQPAIEQTQTTLGRLPNYTLWAPCSPGELGPDPTPAPTPPTGPATISASSNVQPRLVKSHGTWFIVDVGGGGDCAWYTIIELFRHHGPALFAHLGFSAVRDSHNLLDNAMLQLRTYVTTWLTANKVKILAEWPQAFKADVSGGEFAANPHLYEPAEGFAVVNPAGLKFWTRIKDAHTTAALAIRGINESNQVRFYDAMVESANFGKQGMLQHSDEYEEQKNNAIFAAGDAFIKSAKPVPLEWAAVLKDADAASKQFDAFVAAYSTPASFAQDYDILWSAIKLLLCGANSIRLHDSIDGEVAKEYAHNHDWSDQLPDQDTYTASLPTDGWDVWWLKGGGGHYQVMIPIAPRHNLGILAQSRRLDNGVTLVLVTGNIADFDGDVIVNAANEAGLDGGGVDKAINIAAGKDKFIAIRTDQMTLESPGVRIRTGTAKATDAKTSLHTDHVIHAVGPAYGTGDLTANNALLLSAYQESLTLFLDLSKSSIAFPVLSGGIFAGGNAAAIRTAACKHLHDITSAWPPTDGKGKFVYLVAYTAFEQQELLKAAACEWGLLGGLFIPDAVKLLRYRMERHLPVALAEMKAGKKTTDWAWWAFPTTYAGVSEVNAVRSLDTTDLGGQTVVTSATANALLAVAPHLWQEVLEAVVAQRPATAMFPGLFPEIDKGRILGFVAFWRSVHSIPQWLTAVVDAIATANQ
jgi:O-acetyl-ADP-ribose deacetylase (regulator of RNase III)